MTRRLHSERWVFPGVRLERARAGLSTYHLNRLLTWIVRRAAFGQLRQFVYHSSGKLQIKFVHVRNGRIGHYSTKSAHHECQILSRKLFMQHVLEELVLPDRYERLRDHLGDDIANLLVQPSQENVNDLRILAGEINSRNEGVLIPLSGRTGIGKTTFAMNAEQWVPGAFTLSLQYEGSLDFESLSNAVKNFSESFPANSRKIIPINIDHRENAPPSDSELASIKRFLRTNAAGSPVILFWPETDANTCLLYTSDAAEILLV